MPITNHIGQLSLPSLRGM